MSDKVRLLVCRDCTTVEDLPWYEGPPEGDEMLTYLASKHVYPNGERHFGHLMDIEKKCWEIPSARKQILSELGVTTGLGAETYAHIETFKEDAAKCFKAHRRSIPCIDWHSDKKRIQNPTKTGWKNWRPNPMSVYLCDYCVCASHVMTEKQKAAGAYD